MLEFKLTDYCYEANATLEVWTGFRRLTEDSLSQNLPEPELLLVFAPEGRDESPLTEAEKTLANWVIEHQNMQAPAVLNGIVRDYANLTAGVDLDCNTIADIQNPDDLQGEIALSTIFIHPLKKDDIPYIGYSFSCSWEEEHGLGVLMHGSRVVGTGGADTAFLLWIAERDAGGKTAKLTPHEQPKLQPSFFARIRNLFRA